MSVFYPVISLDPAPRVSLYRSFPPIALSSRVNLVNALSLGGTFSVVSFLTGSDSESSPAGIRSEVIVRSYRM